MYELHLCQSLSQKTGISLEEVANVVRHFLPPISAPLSVQRDGAKKASLAAKAWEDKEVRAFNRADEESRKTAAAWAVIFWEIEKLCEREATLAEWKMANGMD